MVGMKLKIVFLLICMAIISSCQTIDKKVVVKTSLDFNEEDILRSRIAEWNEYVHLADDKTLSMVTLLRLTDGYLDAKESLYKYELEDYDAKLDLFNNGSLKTAPLEPTQDYAQLIDYLSKVAEKHRYGRGSDIIRYAIGYALYEQGEIDKAVNIFEDIVDNYPWSDYLVEVSFRLGEIYFDTDQWGSALDAYGIVINYPFSVFYEKALYKISWTYYKLNEFEKAIEAFMAIADRTWEGELNKGGLMEEIVNSMVMSLDRYKDMEKAVRYLKSRGLRGYTPLVLMKLGDRLIEEIRLNEALSIYKQLVELFPADPALPFVYDKMAVLLEGQQGEEAALEARWELVQRFNPTTTWYKKRYPEGHKEIDTLILKQMTYVPKTYHLKGKESNNPKYIDKAVQGYQIFLASFPRSQDAKEINLLLAEALFDTKRYPEAVQEYKKSASLQPAGIERGEVAYSAFLTYEIIFNGADKKAKDATISSAKELLEAYKQDLSKSGKLKKSLYRLAEMYTQLGAFADARESLIQAGTDSTLVQNKVAELYLLEGNLNAAEESYSRLSKKSKDRASIEKLARIRFRIAKGYFDEGKYNDAIAKYHQVFEGYPGSGIGESALVKIGLIYIKNEDISKLEKTVRRIVSSYSGSEDAILLLVQAGQGIEKDDPLKAASLYDYAASITLDSLKAGKLTFAAVSIYEDNSEYGKIETSFERFLVRDVIPFEEKAEALYKLGSVRIRLGKKDEGIKTLRKLLKEKERLDKKLIAKTNLLLLREDQAAYLDIRLIQPFEVTLEKKTRLLNLLVRGYSDIARHGIPEVLPEVFFQMGLVLEEFKNSLLTSERLPDLTQDEKEDYDFLLEEKAYPYEEKAIKAYEKSVFVARKDLLYNNEWIDRSIIKLAKLRPALYKRKFVGIRLEPIVVYPEILGSESEK